MRASARLRTAGAGLLSLLIQVAALAAPPESAPATESRTAATAAPVRVGARTVLTLHAPSGLLSAAERAERANAAIEGAIDDPSCGPEGIETRQGPGGVLLTLCGRNALAITEDDAAREGVAPADLAGRWKTAVVTVFETEKRELYARRLLRRAILGLLYPLAYLAVLWVLRLLFTRAIGRLLRPPDRSAGVRLGPIALLATTAERRMLAVLLKAGKWFAYFFVTYLFLIGLFEHVPRTAHWAARMLQPLGGLAERLAGGAFDLLPRLALALLIAALAHVVLRALGRMFEQVRAGRDRLEPFLSPETAGPAELTARAAVLVTAAFLMALLVPGEAGVFALAALGLLGFTLALGARDLAADYLAGLVVIYGRPVHRGDRVRIGDQEGIIAAKGLLHLTLRTTEGRPVIVPNRAVLAQPLERLGEEEALHLRVIVEARDFGSASGLCRHAAVQSGLRREEGQIAVHAIREGRLVLDVRWPVPDGRQEPEVRSALLAALLDLAPGLGVRVMTAHLAGTPPPAP